MNFIYPFIISFMLVFFSELGDKTQLLVLSFSTKDKAKNILKVVLDEAVVKQIKSATMVKVGFKYEDDTNFRVFPLSQVDLNYWKNQL